MSRPTRLLCAGLRHEAVSKAARRCRKPWFRAPGPGPVLPNSQSIRSIHTWTDGSPAEYLRDMMNRSPVRRCIMTRQDIPSDYLIRFGASPVEPHGSKRNSLRLTPRSMSYSPCAPPAGSAKFSEKGVWVSCRRDAVQAVTRPGPHLGATSKFPNLKIPLDLASQVEDQLVQRVITELIGSGSPGSILRRTTTTEIEHVLQEGRLGKQDRRIMALLDISGARETSTINPSTPISLSALAEREGVPYFLLSQSFGRQNYQAIEAASKAALTASERSGATGEDSSLFAIHYEPGSLAGWPLVRALLRLRLWSGPEWVDRFADSVP